MSNKLIGDWGERTAENFLQEHGYRIMERNYRYSRGEIDLIVEKEGLLIFVEVKTRSSHKFGFPEEAIDDNKQKWILEVADHYIHQVNWEEGIRFDIISILRGVKTEILHIQDAF